MLIFDIIIYYVYSFYLSIFSLHIIYYTFLKLINKYLVMYMFSSTNHFNRLCFYRITAEKYVILSLFWLFCYVEIHKKVKGHKPLHFLYNKNFSIYNPHHRIKKISPIRNNEILSHSTGWSETYEAFYIS